MQRGWSSHRGSRSYAEANKVDAETGRSVGEFFSVG